MHHSLRRLAVVVFLAFCGLSVQPVGSASAALVPTASGSGCSDILVVGATGNAETATAAQPLGHTLSALTDGYVQAAQGARSIRQILVPQTTQALGVLTNGWGPNTPADRLVTKASATRWSGDLAGYTDAIGATLIAQEAACPTQQIVLAGYAQGAMALHRLMWRLARFRPNIFRQIVWVALVSDGDRVSDSLATRRGLPAASVGGSGVTSHLFSPRLDVPQSGWPVPAFSVCTQYDLQCDLTSATLRRARRAASSYRTPGGVTLLQELGARIWRRTAMFALPVPTTAVSGRVGAPLTTQIGVRVADGQAPNVRFSDVGGVPAGVSLSDTGKLAGRPTTAGTYTIDYAVANTASSSLDYPVPGSLTLTVAKAAPTPTPTKTPTPTSTPIGSGPTSGPSPGPAATNWSSKIAAGAAHSCRVFAGTLKCWGANDQGQLGLGVTGGDKAKPVSVPGSTWSSVSAGGDTTCAIRSDSSLWCWGLNHRGQIGDGTRTRRTSPTRVGSDQWVGVSTSWYQSCGVHTDGSGWCWGDNSRGQLGNGTPMSSTLPTQVPGVWRSIATSGWSTCGIKSDASLWCWGDNRLGELGTGNFAGRHTPTQIGTGHSWSTVAVSWGNACAVTTSGSGYCWGRNDQGQVGDGTRDAAVNTPELVSGGKTWRTLAPADSSICGLDTVGHVWCWGSDHYGQLGDSQSTDSLTPVAARVGTYDALASGWLHSCALSAGVPTCWGDNEHGQLGNGSHIDSATWVPSTPAPAGTTTSFRIGTLNVLGSNHTTPGRGQDQWPDYRIRAEWTGQLIRRLGVSILGTQETQADQLPALLKATGPEFATWPGTSIGNDGVQTTVLYDSSQWKMVDHQTITIPFIHWQRPNPVVRLRNKATGKEIWVVNVHNAPRGYSAQRTEDLRIEVAKLLDLESSGVPIFFVGDMNDQKAPFCTVVGQTDLVSSLPGGSVSDGSCTRPPAAKRIDWMFESPQVQVDDYTDTKDALEMRASDHALLSMRVTLP